MREILTIDKLVSALEYNPETGALIFKERPNARPCWNARHAGKPALSSLGPDGYFRGYLFSKMTLAHRIAFAIYTGRTDIGFIDHVNGLRNDNRAVNLREVSRLENAKNKARPSNSTTGYIGVSQTYDGKFRAYITVHNKTIHLGRFAKIEAAISARENAQQVYGFHENHGRNPFIEGATT